MLVLDSIQPDKWYSVKEVAAILGFSDDTIIRQVNRGLLKAFVLPRKPTRRRSFFSRRIRGADLVEFIRRYMNPN